MRGEVRAARSGAAGARARPSSGPLRAAVPPPFPLAPVAAINKLLSSWQLRFPAGRAALPCGPEESSGVGVLWGRASPRSCRPALFRFSGCTEAGRTRLSGCRVVARSPSLETPAAVNKIKQLLKDKPEHVGVKVGVRTRGCNGLSYTLEYTKTKGDSDEEVIQDGVRVFIEKKAQLTLLGTEMDYVEDKLSSEFVFNNPNIKGTCGCGESFNI
ncbi:iron-sulfur cluster assembly 1 homolog, mitochondrial isoform X2 [Callithrix jacchus]|uniref:iron-sulfur cluster assembly 1 homolog, mitochondrial isoform X1 n=1 Tax=Callithrix jacchus TaxID=9483 RepID=UPI00083FA71F|nr:iron-sulfur cluster assembly 1 homolog, mitochondrial isoform X1 [Callithrix jacchus]